MNTDLMIVSVDDHILEPPDLWESRLPKRLRERGPRAVEEVGTGQVWYLDGERIELNSMMGAAGADLDSWELKGLHWDQVRPGCYDPIERVKDMDLDGVLASLCFPNLCGFGGTKFQQLEDKELAMACIRAYNDYQIDEWAGAAPGRLFAQVLIPYWDPALAVAEIERTAALGARAIAFTEYPLYQGFPSIHSPHWDSVFDAADANQLPLCMHIGSSSHPVPTGEDGPEIIKLGFGTHWMGCLTSMIDWLLGTRFERHPTLKVVYAEGYIGWIPFAVEHCDRNWNRHRVWTDNPLPKPPSEYFADHVFGCFIEDAVGCDLIERIGVDNLMVESDYPHPDGTWPNTVAMFEKQLAHLPADAQYKIRRGNAERVYNLDLA